MLDAVALKNTEHSYTGEVVANYDRDRQSEEHWLLENDFVRDFLMAEPSGRLLDLPVGTGRFFPFYPSGINISAADISGDMLAEARRVAEQLGRSNVDFSEQDITARTSFDDDSFEFITCFRLFHLLSDDQREAALTELRRILKGRLLLQVYLAPETEDSLFFRVRRFVRRLFSGELDLLAGRIAGKPWNHIRNYRLSEPWLLQAIERAGFVIDQRHFLCMYGRQRVEVLVLVVDD